MSKFMRMFKFLVVLFSLFVSAPAFSYNVNTASTDLSGLWWNSSESGWGVSITHQYGTIFAVMFTYDSAGIPTWYFASNCPVTLNGCTSNFYKTNGGSSPTVVWNGANLTETNVGAINFAFSDVDNAVVTYMLNGVTVSKVITRQIFATPPTGSCVAPQVWNAGINSCVYPVGTKVTGSNQIPAGCVTWTSQCWKDSVANGTVKFVATSAAMTGYSTRPIVFAVFKNTTTAFGVVGQWNVFPMYSDDGSPVGGDIAGGMPSEIDWTYGTTKGVIFHLKLSGVCYEMAWDSIYKYWDLNGTGVDMPVTCPL